MLNKIIKSIIILSVFLVPLFYLPFTQSQFQFNKEMLFLTLVLVASLLWLGRAVRQKKLDLIRTPLDIPIILIVVVYGLSVIISSNWVDSLINITGVGLPSFVTILSLALFYFITVNVFVESSLATLSISVWVKLLLGSLLASSVIVQLIVYLSWLNIHVLPGQNVDFNTLGSFSRLSVFIALTLPFALYFLLAKADKSSKNAVIKQVVKILFISFYLILSLITLNTINYPLGWWIATAGSFVFLVLVTTYYSRLPIRFNLTWVAAGVLALSLISLVLRPASLISTFAPSRAPSIPSEAFLSKSISRQMVFSSSVKDPITFLAGKGPGNFTEIFSEERSADFNTSLAWRIRFNQAGNFFYELIGTIGWLGLVTFFVIIIFFFMMSGFVLFKLHPLSVKNGEKGDDLEEQQESAFLLPIIALVSVFVAVIVSFWFSVPSFPVMLILWMIFSVVAIVGIRRAPKYFSKLKFNFKESARDALFSSFGLVFVFVLLLFFGVFLTRVYMGEYYYNSAKTILSRQGIGTESLESARKLVDKAINYNQGRPEYYLTNAQISLTLVQLEVNQKGVKNVDQDLIQQLLAAAINQSNWAVDKSPDTVATWENRGLIFESVSVFTDDARIHAILSFEKATELEPTNPILFYKLGENQRLLWLRNQRVARESGVELSEEQIESNLGLFDEAVINLEKAISLKPSYVPPRLSLSRVRESQNNRAESVRYLKGGLQYRVNQNDSQLYYEIARLLYNQGVLDGFGNQEALKEILAYLNTTLQLSPQHSNALYTRSLIFKEVERYDLAYIDMQQVANLNPDNADVQAKLSALEQLVQGSSPAPQSDFDSDEVTEALVEEEEGDVEEGEEEEEQG